MRSLVLATILTLLTGATLRAQQPANTPPDDLPPEVSALMALLKPQSTSEWRRFDTLREAAIYAAERLEKCSHYYECSGFIDIDPQGKFAVGPVRTDYASDNVRVIDSIGPSDWKSAAGIHSHPCLPEHEPSFFSPEDMIGAITSRIPQYMVDLCTGDVHEFLPGITKPDETLTNEGIYMTHGNIVGHVNAYKEAPLADIGL